MKVGNILTSWIIIKYWIKTPELWNWLDLFNMLAVVSNQCNCAELKAANKPIRPESYVFISNVDTKLP
jgi:hypothetical protein